MTFEKVKAVYDDKGRRSLVSTGEPDQVFEVPAACSSPWGRKTPSPGSRAQRPASISTRWEMPVVNKETMQSSVPNVFFGGDAAVGPHNNNWAAAHAHAAAISIDKFLHGEDVNDRHRPWCSAGMSQKMGIHEWSYDNGVSNDLRFKVPWRDTKITLKNVKVEVELGFDPATAFKEAQRCLNCDVQTVFTKDLCIECDACVDICPMDCITFAPNGEEKELRTRLTAPAANATQDLYVSPDLKTKRVMAKDEDVCLHCGLCAERCPTGAWDMQKTLINMAYAGPSCRDKTPARKAA